jgi:hypothetical protein
MLRSKNHLAAIVSLSLLGTALVASQASGSAYTSTQASKANVVSVASDAANFTHRVQASLFSSPLKKGTWTLYNGVPTCCKQSRWAPTHVVAEHGALRIRSYKDPAFGNKWVSGGVSMARMVNQTYGRWNIRFRMNKGAGVGMDVALRPSGNGTVVDWAEESSDHGAARNWESATLHYGSTRVHANVTANFTKWHTMSILWLPNSIDVLLDGKRWAHYTSHIPSSPMHLVMQTNTGTNGFTGVLPTASTPSRVTLQVDYVTVFRYH